MDRDVQRWVKAYAEDELKENMNVMLDEWEFSLDQKSEIRQAYSKFRRGLFFVDENL